MEQDKFGDEELEKAISNNIYNIVSRFTVNRSEEAETIRESLKDGHILTDEEAFTLVCDDPKQLAMYKKMKDLEKKAKEDKLTPDELKCLTDLVFGEGSKESKQIYDSMIATGRVKKDDEKDKDKSFESTLQEQTYSDDEIDVNKIDAKKEHKGIEDKEI